MGNKRRKTHSKGNTCELVLDILLEVPVGNWITKYERETIYVINAYAIYEIMTVKSSKRTGQNI